MLLVNKKCFTSYGQLWKDNCGQKEITWKVRHDVCQLRKNPQVS